MIERSIRESEAIDVESLCIVGGEKVWSIRCDIRVLDYDGNIIDVASMATVCPLHQLIYTMTKFKIFEIKKTDMYIDILFEDCCTSSIS